jgi:2-hydroxyglutarate dehydrogenase
VHSAEPPGEVDLAVVGGGIVGLAVAREALRRRPDLAVTVLEREREVARHQTGRNSGVIHAGLYYEPGSLKARLCVEGARELYDYCDARGIAVERPGQVVVALRREELPRLEEIERRARANGVPGVRRLSAGELGDVEPNVRGIAALHSPATGTVDFGAVARAIGRDVVENGGTVATGCAVTGVEAAPRRLRMSHPSGAVHARAAVLCAGVWSDRLATAAGAPADPRVVPFRGAYLRLRRHRRDLVHGLVYPVPDPSLPFLGVHVTRHGDGEVLLGPSALLAARREPGRGPRALARDLGATLRWPGTWRLARRHWRTGAGELHRAISRAAVARAASRYVPGIEADDLEPAFSGIRAQALGRDGTLVDDFVLSQTERAVHVRNAPSPAATSALALARLIVDRAAQAMD